MSVTSCAVCGGVVVRGRAVIKKSLMALLSWPWASDRLDFMADPSSDNAETVIRQGREYEAYRCDECGALLITTKVWCPESDSQ